MSTIATTQPPRGNPADTKSTSNLGDGKQRFLSQVVEHAIACGRRSAKDFIRHFPPRAIMLALEGQPRLRANIVVPTIGLHEKVALKKSAAALGEDLQIALDEGVVEEDAVVRLFDADDRVRYLDAKKLWAFVAEGDFWRATPAQAGDVTVAKQHLAYIVDCARTNGLLTDHDVIEGLTIDRVLELAPKGELEKLVRSALVAGRHGRAFDDEALLGAIPPAALLDHVPLAQMWESVVVPRIAVPHGFVAQGFAAAEGSTSTTGTTGTANARPPAPPPIGEEEDIVVEIVDRDSNVGQPLPKAAQKSRRIGALDLSELKGEITDESTRKN
jgi:hypothetical protein